MSVALLLITDGRKECLDRTLRSLSGAWIGPEATMVTVVDDSGVPDYRSWLDRRFRAWNADIISHPARQGFASAIATGWHAIAGATDWVLHCEDDFLFPGRFPIPDMIALLEHRPHLAQVSLLRQAVAESEIAAGGLVQAWPDQFVDHELVLGAERRVLQWMEQRVYFTTNPSIYPASLVELGWPQEPHSEGVFTHRLMKDGFGDIAGPDVRFGVWGHAGDKPRVTHTGVRQGMGY